MAKKRRVGPTGPKAVWVTDDDIPLFGLLDFCIKFKRVFSFNEEFVVGRLFQSTNPSIFYTWVQITRRLEKLWNDYGSTNSVKKDVYKKGSACVTGFTEDDQGAIELEVERLKNDWTLGKLLPNQSTPRKELYEIPVTRKTTSKSPSTVRRGRSYTSEYDVSDITQHSTPRAQRKQVRDLTKQSKRKRESPQGILHEEDTPSKKIQQTEKDPQNRYMQQEKQDSEDLQKGIEPLVLEDIESEPSRENEKDDNTSAGSTSEDRSPREFTSLRLGSEIRQLQGDPVPSITTLQRIHKAELKKKDEKILKLEDIIDGNKEEIAELQAQLDSFQSARETRQEGIGSLEFLFSELDQENRYLRKRVENCRNIGKFTKRAGSYEAARQQMHIDKPVSTIRRLMKRIVSTNGDIKLKVPGLNLTPGFNALLSFGFGFNGQTPSWEEQLESLLLNHSAYSIIETLIEAAVCIWVFEYSFPNYVQEPAVVSLFMKYRELIAFQDGAIALYNLELASHHALINTLRFQKVMEKEAEDLATSLSKTLAPFFARNAEDSENNCFETWGEEEAVWKIRREQLVTIFKDSLKIKAHSLLTPEQYELVHYAPGTIFDPATMKIETIDGAPVNDPTGEGYKVKHCLHVAIRAFTMEPVKDTDAVSKATIQYKNFTYGDGTRPLGATGAVLVKAVVILTK